MFGEDDELLSDDELATLFGEDDEALSPEEAAALGISNSPVTEEAAAGSTMDQYFPGFDAETSGMVRSGENFDNAVLGSLGVAVDSTMNSATGGAYGLAGTAMDTARRWATAPDDTDMSFSDFWRMSERAKQDARDQYPIADAGGTALGAITGGLGSARALEAAAKSGDDVAKALTQTLKGRMGAATVGGALEAAGDAAGRGQIDGYSDLAGNLGLGAAFGAGGQLLGEGGALAYRKLAERLPEGWGTAVKDTRAARDVFGQLTEGSTGPGSLPALLNDANKMEISDYLKMMETAHPGTVLGETSDDMLGITAAFAGNKNTTGKTRPIRELAAARQKELSSSARNVLLDNLDGVVDLPITPKNNDEFRAIFNTPAARNTPVTDKASLIGGLSQLKRPNGDPFLDHVNRRGPSERIVARLADELDDITDREGITLQALQNVKLKLSDATAKAWRGADDAAYKLDAMDLTTLKNYVNDQIKLIDPDYAAVAATRAEHEVEKNMIDLGRDLISGSTKSQPINDVVEQLKTLSEPERLRVRQGAAEFLRDKVKDQPTFLKKLASENPGLMERAEAILGPHFASNGTSLAEIAQSIDTKLAKTGKYAAIERASIGQASNAPGPNQEDLAGLRRMVDIATPILRVAAGEGVAAPISNAARRLADTTPARAQVKLMEILSANKEKLPKLLSLLEEAMAAPNARLTGGAIGSSMGTGLSSRFRE